MQQWLTLFTKLLQSVTDDYVLNKDGSTSPYPPSRPQDSSTLPPSVSRVSLAAPETVLETPSAPFLLMISRVCLDFAKRYVRQTVELTASLFPVRAARRGRPPQDRAELTDIDELVISEHSKNLREYGEV